MVEVGDVQQQFNFVVGRLGGDIPRIHGPDQPVRQRTPRDGTHHIPQRRHIRHDGPGRTSPAPGTSWLGRLHGGRDPGETQGGRGNRGTGRIPERPYGPNSLKCRYCNYNLLCRGPDAETVEKLRYTDNGYEVKQVWNADDPELIGAAQRK